MPKSIPFFCPECVRPGACGFHGILGFEGQDPPICNHNERPAKGSKEKPAVCHETAIMMVPSR